MSLVAFFAGVWARRRASERDTRLRLQTIFDQNYRLVWRVARRMGVPSHSVDDAAQQVFVIATERIHDIVPGRERAFLYGTTIRVARSMRRRCGREPPTDEAETRVSPHANPEELTDQKRARELLDTILARMTADLRTVFVLFEIEGLTTPEIAELLAIPLGTAASRLRRARESFRTLVAAVGGPAPTEEEPDP